MSSAALRTPPHFSDMYCVNARVQPACLHVGCTMAHLHLLQTIHKSFGLFEQTSFRHLYQSKERIALHEPHLTATSVTA